MASYRDAIDVRPGIEAAFDYLADFGRTAEWDPGVSSAFRRTAGSPRLGSQFVVNIWVLGTEIPLEFEITEYERPKRLVLSGGNAVIRCEDKISFVSRTKGTRVTYEAAVELIGLSRLADPILNVLLQRVGQLAIRGLRERLDGEPRVKHPTTTHPLNL